jgi:acylphosphatase
MEVRFHVWISGRVHGVGFRYYVERMAENLGVSGWVRNNPDGSVEAVLEGEEKAVGKMIELCRKGPATAHVTSVEAVKEKHTGEFRNFGIRF